MKKTAIGLALMLAATTSSADDWWVNIHLKSDHLQSDVYLDLNNEPVPYQQDNFGLGFGYTINSWIEARAGLFRTSFDTLGAYGGALFHTSFNRPVAVGLNTGGAYGYEDTVYKQTYNEPITPYATPTFIILPTTYYRIEVGYIPETPSIKNGSVLTISLGVKFR